jgi:lycopene beta-cyclase
MTGSPSIDVVVCGAGAAGLSLAARLVGSGLSVELFDPRTSFGDDRTFSGFHFAGSHPFESAIEHRYRALTLFGPDGREVRRTTGAHPYVRIGGELFYAAALRMIAGDTRIRLVLGTQVEALEPEADGVVVRTSGGTTRARFVIDARGRFAPATTPASAPALSQVFVGHVVRTERPIFDPDRATLMDFRLPQQRGPHFMYVLPESERVALVEDTYFLPAADQRELDHDDAIRGWLDRAGAGSFEVLRRERGVLPMTAAPAEPTGSPRIVRLGVAGGAAKGSTGYAFAFIQRHADALARVLRQRPVRPPRWPTVRTPTATFFDAVFLRFAVDCLPEHPEHVGEALVGLFERADPALVARFLGERAGPLDFVQVMASMPTVPFVRAASVQYGR